MSAVPLCVSVVRNADDLFAAMAVRAVTYMHEQACPFSEEYDGNDHCALHLVARARHEPVGTCRIRWFAGFAKLEHVAVRAEWRGGKVVRALWREASDIISRKGYRYVLGYIEGDLLAVWGRVGGFRVRTGRPPIRFSDREYFEALAELEPHPHAITLDSAALHMVRPEGDWDRAGVLDQSNLRLVAAE